MHNSSLYCCKASKSIERRCILSFCGSRADQKRDNYQFPKRTINSGGTNHNSQNSKHLGVVHTWAMCCPQRTVTGKRVHKHTCYEMQTGWLCQGKIIFGRKPFLCNLPLYIVYLKNKRERSRSTWNNLVRWFREWPPRCVATSRTGSDQLVLKKLSCMEK